jgi:hypothetical protein
MSKLELVYTRTIHLRVHLSRFPKAGNQCVPWGVRGSEVEVVPFKIETLNVYLAPFGYRARPIQTTTDIIILASPKGATLFCRPRLTITLSTGPKA